MLSDCARGPTVGTGKKLPGSALESVKQRTTEHVDSKIYGKGHAVKASLKLYAQTFSRLYVINSKNGYSPSTGDNDGKITWDATERACAGEFSAPMALALSHWHIDSSAHPALT